MFWYCRNGRTVMLGAGGGPVGTTSGGPKATWSMKSVMSLRNTLNLPRRLSPDVNKSFFFRLKPISLFLPIWGQRLGLGRKQNGEGAPGPGVPGGQRKNESLTV